MGGYNDQQRYVDVAGAEGAVLEELVALALYYPSGYPPFGLHGVCVEAGVCHVFRDGVGEFLFAPLTDDDDAMSVYQIMARPLDEPGSAGRVAALRDYVRAVRGPRVDREQMSHGVAGADQAGR